MANQGWPNGGGGGEQTSSTARQSGRGSDAGEYWQGSKIAHPSGGDSDPLGAPGDVFEVPGNLSES